MQLQYLDIRAAKDIETAFRAARKRRADSVLGLGSPVLMSHRTLVVDFAATNRLPTIYYFPEFVEAGGLMNYGPSVTDLSRRAASMWTRF
jgi:putative ABC transport system substrate-binding protein